jgi:hypothetical protein
MLTLERSSSMRQKLTLGILVICALLLANTRGAATRHASENASATSPAATSLGTGSGKNIKGEGCVRAGVEAGCFIFTSADKKTKYALHFDPNNKPSADTMIHFEGVTTDEDFCMQGTPVKVTKWNALKTKCPPESK